MLDEDKLCLIPIALEYETIAFNCLLSEVVVEANRGESDREGSLKGHLDILRRHNELSYEHFE